MSQVLVAPFDPQLVPRLRGHPVVLRVDAADRIAEAMAAAGDHGLDVRRVWFETPGPLTAIALAGISYRGAPLALSASSLGPFRECLRQLPALRALRTRVYLPVTPPGNLIALRQLASLGVEAAAVLQPDADWEALADLMTYALFGVAPHAPVQPFAHLADAYRSNQRTDFGAVYHEDPTEFLHVDAAGRLALSAADLAAGRFLPLGLQRVKEVPSLPEYRDRVDGWTHFFMQLDGCGCCAGFRICLGRFAGAGASAGGAAGCSAFFGEVIDDLERARQVRADRSGSWPR